MNLSVVSETASTITYGWTPVQKAIGYVFTAEKQAKPTHTWDPLRSTVKFSKGSDWYRVEALGVTHEGVKVLKGSGPLSRVLGGVPLPPDPSPPPPVGNIVPAPANLASLQATYPAGSVIPLGAGYHGDQTFTLNKIVTFVGEPGARLGNVNFNAGCGNIELKNLETDLVSVGTNFVSSGPGGSFPSPAVDITLRNIDADRFTMALARRIRIYGGDYGIVGGQQSRNTLAPINPWDGLNVPHDILIDGAYMHDMGMFNAGGAHTEGLLVYGVNGLVVRNCTFQRNGGTGAIGLFHLDPNIWQAGWGASNFPAVANIIITNNVSLDQPGQYAPGQPFHGYFDVQTHENSLLPGLNYTQLETTNTWPRGYYEFVQVCPVAVPNPSAPANWPP